MGQSLGVTPQNYSGNFLTAIVSAALPIISPIFLVKKRYLVETIEAF